MGAGQNVPSPKRTKQKRTQFWSKRTYQHVPMFWSKRTLSIYVKNHAL